MMEWYQMLSYLFTNGIRILLCLYLIAGLLELKSHKKILGIAAGIAGLVTVAAQLSLSRLQLIGLEIVLLLLVTLLIKRKELRVSLFFIFFYEIAVALWEFIISMALAILFGDLEFIRENSPAYMAAIWLVRLIMLAVAVLVWRSENRNFFKMAVTLAVMSFFGVTSIAEQTVVVLEQDTISTWTYLTVIFMFSILVYKLNYQYELEKEVARLKTEQAEVLRNDYQKLNTLYSANAKLYHDLHNHMEMMHCYLTQGKVEEAASYLEELRTPVKEIVQMIWTGDEALDYLINSKLSLMKEKQIRIKTNIEFPRNTNIRGAVLTAILGNLLDNAMEAAQKCGEDYRFVYLTIRRINNMLIIKVENGFEDKPVSEGGELETTKEDKQLHGWGLKSARTAAEHYDGIVETSFQNHTFCAVATLFF